MVQRGKKDPVIYVIYSRGWACCAIWMICDFGKFRERLIYRQINLSNVDDGVSLLK